MDRTAQRRESVPGDRGAVMAEYGLVAFLIAVLVLVSAAIFGDSVLGVFQDIIDALPF
jgi:Flp pilus assembly pilin Flp